MKEKGVVIIQFIVEKDGSISSPTIARSFKAELDTLSLNLVSNMPKWIPGEADNGNKVRCKYSVPIQFKPKEPEAPKKVASKKPVAQPVKPVQDSLAQDTLVSSKPQEAIKPMPADSLKTLSPTEAETVKPVTSTDSIPGTVPEQELIPAPGGSLTHPVLPPGKESPADTRQTQGNDTIPPVKKVSE